MIQIILNGKKMETEYNTAFDLRNAFYTHEDVLVVNGFQIQENVNLNNGDTVVIIKKGVMPEEDEWESMLSARHTPGVYKKLKKGKIAIAGLGGLGSNIAIILARTGVGKILLVDFDVIEPSNLNRQQYSISDLGSYKTEALKEIISQINPFIQVEIKTIKITEDNVFELFEDYDIVCEAFDKADQKAMLINSLSKQLPNIRVVSGSGMAGFESANTIQTKKLLNNLYVSGDLKNEAQAFNGLMAPRVTVCAAHQSNMIIRLLLGINEP
jgi:sulfur carrier protein ThiS adenylyltransferase